MDRKLALLFEKYQPLGQWKAGELLLKPADALRFADELAAVGVRIWGVDLWYYVEDGICEDPGCLDLSSLWGAEPAEFVVEVKQLITSRLPPHIALVSFV